jgi:hypothetical protein
MHLTYQSECRYMSRNERWFWVLLFIGVIAFRIPELLKGRFWAEEGRVFFQIAYELPVHKALLFTHSGYLNLIGNVGGVLANCVPLKYACRVTLCLSLIVQSLPLILLALSRASWLKQRKLFVASLLFIATIPMCQEVWLNTSCAHYHLTLCAALILSLDAGVGLVRIFHCFILFLAALSGPGSMLLTPLFLVRALFTRSKARIMYLLCIGLATAIQLGCFWKPVERHVQNLSGEQLAFGIDPLLLLKIVFVKHIVSPFMGLRETQEIAGGWATAYQHGNLHLGPQIIFTVVVFAALAYSLYRCKLEEGKWFFATALVLLIVGYAGSLGSRTDSLLIGINERYAFVPQILLELSLLVLISQVSGWKKRALQTTAVWLIAVGIHDFAECPSQFADGPSWKKEVQAWQLDPTHALRIWPSDWAIKLKPKDQS